MTAPEFDGTPMTEREVRIARDAYLAGLNEALPYGMSETEWVEERYPLPEEDDQ